jgi:GNAT superfamily N-acetyltransferase
MSIGLEPAAAEYRGAGYTIRPAEPGDVGRLLAMIRALAVYERLEHMVVADEALLARSVFGPARVVEALFIGPGDARGGREAGFALYFHNFSTFLGRPGLYLEDLFVEPEARGRGYGRALMLYLARLAHARGCGRFEWSVLDWNEPSIRFYRSLGAVGMDEWRLQRVAGPALEALAQAPLP